MNGPLARGLCSWIALAASSFPVPVSPSDQHGHIGRGDPGDARPEEAHRLALADEHRIARARLGPQAHDLLAQRADLREALDI